MIRLPSAAGVFTAAVDADRRMLTTVQVAAALRVHLVTVFRMLKEGKLRGMKIGRVWRISPEEVDRILHSHEPIK